MKENSRLREHQENIQEKGFTLIELLIVIGVLGVLAAVLLVAINPLEQFARTRDSGRLSQTTQLGRALAQYATTQGGGTYVVSGGTWMTTLVTANEISTALTAPANNVVACTINPQGGYCYQTYSAGTDAAVWTPVESKSSTVKATCGVGKTYVIAVYIESQGKAGLDCVTDKTTAPAVADILY